jgi:hypothetical protein
MRNFSLLLIASLGACAWTEFDDLRDEAWVVAITKPEDSDATNWGVAMVRGKQTSATGGTLAVFGTAPSRQHETTFDFKGSATLLEQDLGDLGIANLAIEPIVIEDPTSDNFAVVTQGSSMQVVVGAGQGVNLQQTVVNDAGIVDAAVYIVAPQIDTDQARSTTRMAQVAQPLIASGDRLYGTYFNAPNPQFQQVHCQLVFNGTPVQARAVGAVRIDPAASTDDIAVWGDDGNMYILDGHIFNGHRAGALGGTYPTDYLCPSTGPTDVNGVIDPRAVLTVAEIPTLVTNPTPVNFTVGANTAAQIIKIDDTHSLLQGHGQNDGFMVLWDWSTNTAVGQAVAEPGLKSATVFTNDAGTFVVAGYPGAIVDGVAAGKVQIYAIDVATGIDTVAREELRDAQPEDGQQFGRSVAAFAFNDTQVFAVGASNEIFIYFRTREVIATETRQ